MKHRRCLHTTHVRVINVPRLSINKHQSLSVILHFTLYFYD